MNSPIKADYWVCSEQECGMELIKNYSKIKEEFLGCVAWSSVHAEDYIMNELNKYLEKLQQKESILGYTNEANSPYRKAIEETENSIQGFKELHATIELNRMLLKNPKTLIPGIPKGYRLKDKVKLLLGLEQ